jgi:hypothetical protein
MKRSSILHLIHGFGSNSFIMNKIRVARVNPSQGVKHNKFDFRDKGG